MQIQAKSVGPNRRNKSFENPIQKHFAQSLPPLFAWKVSFVYAGNMPERTTEQKFWDAYSEYKKAKDKGDATVSALLCIDRLNELLGPDKFKDKNECAKVLNSAGIITHQQALEDYEELYQDAKRVYGSKNIRFS